LSIFTDIFAALAASSAPNIYETIVKQALPTLCTSIGSAQPNESWIAGSAIDLVSSLVKGAPESGLGEGFFALLAPNLFECLRQAEDRDVLQVRLLFRGLKQGLTEAWLVAEWSCMLDSRHPQRL
jgi:hypothetical protein